MPRSVVKLVEQLRFLMQAAKGAGIWHAVFLGYGTCLGAVREGKIIGHDSDADICIMSDWITKEQEDKYYQTLWDMGLFRARHKEARRRDNGRLLWCSLKQRKGGMKTCNWFQFLYDGMYWHSKGRNWVRKIGMRLNPTVDQSIQAIGKGTPKHLFKHLITIKFYEMDWKIPLAFGEWLTFMYDDFMTPRRGGASRSPYILLVPDWNKPEKWTRLVR